MRLTLEARPQPSRAAVWLAPLLATLATLIVGFIVFKAFGKDPIAAFGAFFIQPVATLYGVAELLLKATPLMLIATGLAIGYRANVWNIGAEGQLTMGAIAGGGAALALGDAEWPAALHAAGDVRPWRARRHAVGGDSRVAANALQRQRDPDIADARLRRDAVPVVARPRPVARSGGLQLSAIETVRRQRPAADSRSRRRASMRRY